MAHFVPVILSGGAGSRLWPVSREALPKPFIARELLREPYWALKAQHELGAEATWPIPYGYAVKRRAK